MSRFARRLVTVFGTIAVLLVITSCMALIVQYKPYGVPDEKRDDYEARVAALRADEADRKMRANQPKPIAVAKERFFDFGLLDPHVTARHAFEIGNEGETALTLDVTETTCKCTVGQLGKKVLLPGEFTTVTMEWNTGYQADRYEQSAIVRTNDPNRAIVKLRVAGTVRAKLVAPQHVRLRTANPGELNRGTFIVYSQLWRELIIEDVQSELLGLDWDVEPVDPASQNGLADAEALAAWRVNVSCLSNSPGMFQEPIHLKLRGAESGETLDRTVSLSGKVHQPISFIGPNLDSRTGLDLGTMTNDRDHVTHLIVRQRDKMNRALQVMKVEPATLQASLEEVGNDGDYRLTLKFPTGSQPVLFNMETQHGYVEIGDPETPGLSNWFPVHGALIKLDRS
ncbi:MAG: DUF1573 domain-containing protein [Planctomycetota bacterium]